jgi:hypothetical protein
MRFSMTATPNRAPIYASAYVSEKALRHTTYPNCAPRYASSYVSTSQHTTDCYLEEVERKDEVEHGGDSEISRLYSIMYSSMPGTYMAECLEVYIA